jgi:hypothetical protein
VGGGAGGALLAPPPPPAPRVADADVGAVSEAGGVAGAEAAAGGVAVAPAEAIGQRLGSGERESERLAGGERDAEGEGVPLSLLDGEADRGAGIVGVGAAPTDSLPARERCGERLVEAHALPEREPRSEREAETHAVGCCGEGVAGADVSALAVGGRLTVGEVPGEGDAEELPKALAVFDAEREGGGEREPLPLREARPPLPLAALDRLGGAECVSVPLTASLADAEALSEGSPTARRRLAGGEGDALASAEDRGDTEGEGVPAPVGEARGDAEGEGDRVRVWLREGLSDCEALAGADREAHGDGDVEGDDEVLLEKDTDARARLGRPDAEADAEASGEGDAAGEALGFALREAERDAGGEGSDVALPRALRDSLAARVPLPLRPPLRVGEGEPLSSGGEGEGPAESRALHDGLPLASGERDAEGEGNADGDVRGEREALGDARSDLVGAATREGEGVADAESEGEGECEGDPEGAALPLTLPLALPLPVAPLRDAEGVRAGEGEARASPLARAARDAEPHAESEPVTTALREAEGEPEGESLAALLPLAAAAVAVSNDVMECEGVAGGLGEGGEDSAADAVGGAPVALPPPPLPLGATLPEVLSRGCDGSGEALPLALGESDAEAQGEGEAAPDVDAPARGEPLGALPVAESVPHRETTAVAEGEAEPVDAGDAVTLAVAPALPVGSGDADSEAQGLADRVSAACVTDVDAIASGERLGL